jgi:HK97 family phage portal protein
VSVGKDASGSPVYDIRDERNHVISRETPATVIHIPLMRKPGEQRGTSMIEANQEAIGLGLAAEEYGARFFGNGATMSGIVEYPIGVDPTPEQVKVILDGINKSHRGTKKAHAIGALTNGAAYKQLSIDPDHAQFLETQKWVLEQVGRMVGLPPHKQGSQEPGAVSYNSVEIRNIDYVNDALMPLSGRIELAYGRLLPRPDDYLKFEFDSLLRGDVKTRWAAYESGLRWGVYDLDEIRAKEDENPIADGLGKTRPFPLTYAPLDRVRAMPLPIDPPGPRPAPAVENQ